MTPPKDAGAKDAALREEEARAAESQKSSMQKTAEQSTATAANSGARKMRMEGGQIVYEDISTDEGAVSQTQKQAEKHGAEGARTEYDRADVRASQGLGGEAPDDSGRSIAGSMFVPVTGDVNAEGAKSRKDVREVVGPNGEKLLVSPNRAVAGAIDTPNIIQEPDGRLVSPFQPNKHTEVEITGAGGGSARGASPRAKLIRSAPEALSDELIDSMSSAELRAVAHDRGYNIGTMTAAHTVRGKFREAQKEDKNLVKGAAKQAQDTAEKAFSLAQKSQSEAVKELEKAADELAKQREEARARAEGGDATPVQTIKASDSEE